MREHFTRLHEERGFFFGDEAMTRPELLRKYEALGQKVREYQLRP